MICSRQSKERYSSASPFIDGRNQAKAWTAIQLLDGHQQDRADRMQDLKQAMTKLAMDIQFIRGVGPRLAQLLARKGVKNIEDIFYFLPRRYEDRRIVQKIAQARVGVKETVIGKVVHADVRPIKGGGPLRSLSTTAADPSRPRVQGSLAYLKNTFKTGVQVILTGEIRLFKAGKDMIHPDYEILDEDDSNLLHFKRIVPIYSETEACIKNAAEDRHARARRFTPAISRAPSPRHFVKNIA